MAVDLLKQTLFVLGYGSLLSVRDHRDLHYSKIILTNLNASENYTIVYNAGGKIFTLKKHTLYREIYGQTTKINNNFIPCLSIGQKPKKKL